ncbi:tubulin-folding cofactor A-like isoform X1 [Arachis ipaensis]|uniref:tubulin-folding cofactor A-like isoform X1 n=1 Tax=Arachis ipaensis TaxID=130454 RepID=UPI000A2B8E87|nr:tubulin-folding cofactor A-like isoform X1 [Arachis ipaensis]
MGTPTMVVSTDPAHSLSNSFAQKNVLAESRMMIPDFHKRLKATLVDLKGALAELEESNEKEGPEIDDARNTIAEVEKVVRTTEA